MTPNVFIVGADKGGVGKTTIARALLDYLYLNGIEYRAFDAEAPHGSLKRFASNKTDIVDLTKSDDQMKVFDKLNTTPVTVLDLRAGLLSPTLQTLSDIGFLEQAQQGKIKITALHVLGPASTSLDEVRPIIGALSGSRHIPIANHINDTAFIAPDNALNIPKLDENACKDVDRLAMSFEDYTASSESMVLRGYVRHWLKRVYEQFSNARLSAL